jgi:hypothetical protein
VQVACHLAIPMYMHRKQAKAMLSVASLAVLGGVTLTAGGLAAVKAIASMSEQRTQQEQQPTYTDVCIHVYEAMSLRKYIIAIPEVSH